MKNKEIKTFDSVAFFRKIKEKFSPKNGRYEYGSEKRGYDTY